MNWQKLLSDLRRVLTLQEIADECGLASRGAVHNLATGKQETVTYDVGAKLVAMHAERLPDILTAIRAEKKAAKNAG